MKETSRTPKWVPVFLGFFTFGMGTLILGTVLGLLPTEEGAYFASKFIVAAIGFGLILSAILFWIPMTAPSLIKSALFFLVLFLVAIVCNWSAFAPNVHYWSNTSIGPISMGGEDQIGGRIVFGIVALIIDAFLVDALIAQIRKRNRKN